MSSAIKNKNRKSLKILTKQYNEQLSHNFPHQCYYNAFSTARKENCGKTPTLDQFEIREATLTASLPYPLCSPVPMESYNDSCQQLLLDKQKYNKKIIYCKKQFQNDKKWLKPGYFKENNKVGTLPEYFLDLATERVKDVDPYFESDYDYYYTGGNMSQITFNGVPYLIRPVQCDQICFTNTEEPKINYFLNTDSKPIYNLKSYNFENKEFLTIRQKHALSLYKIDLTADFFTAKKFWIKKSEDVPFIDVKYIDTSEIGYINVKNEFSIDTVDGQTSFSQSFPLKDEKCYLAQIEFLNRNVVSCMTSSDLHLLDRRSREKRSVNIKKGFFLCNNLCCLTVGKTDKNYIYLTSKHEIQKFDIRQMEVVKKWSNLLSQSPVITKICTVGKEECLFSTSFLETVCLCMSRHENYLPFKVPHVKQTLNEVALKRGKMSDDEVDKRIRLSIAGLEIVNESKHLNLYTSNSIGDIFSSKLGYDKGLTEQPIELMMKWLKKLPARPKVLKVTSFQEMSDMKTVLTKTTKRKTVQKFIGENRKEGKLLKAAHEINKYALAQIWGDNERLDLGSGGEEILRPITPRHKVSEWLEKNSNEENPVTWT